MQTQGSPQPMETVLQICAEILSVLVVECPQPLLLDLFHVQLDVLNVHILIYFLLHFLLISQHFLHLFCQQMPSFQQVQAYKSQIYVAGWLAALIVVKVFHLQKSCFNI